ncbi:hypothetical protein EYC58_00515 [Candidatus Saccharibacteria bacterium]|nr:MAG: hypothetical protein EYC58_00515 [Candidatus Saccharibacteria bacterium]
MPELKQLTGLKKRQQIASANKMIFVWVIIASVVVSLCGVTMQFLVRQAIFNQKIINEKLKTQSTLSKNIENVAKLKQNIDALQADTNLAQVKANPEDTNLKVVLDALPTTDDRTALGASLQQVILPKSGVNTSDITTVSQASSDATTPLATSSETPTANFTFAATGDYPRIKSMLSDLERTIRPLNVQKLSLQGVDGQVKAAVEGVTYYLPPQTVQLGKKSIKP